MEMKLSQRLLQTQRLVMTPKLQQALKLLQVPTIELQQILKQEILQNPMLEEVDELQDDEAEDVQEEPETASDGDQQGTEDIDWDEYFRSGFEQGFGRMEETPEDFYEKVPVARQSFSDQLMTQLRLVSDDPTTLAIGEYIIGSLANSGYLTCELEEIAGTFRVDVSEVERVLKIIQTFDPPGVGARNLQECLLIQLEAKSLRDSLAYRIVQGHFEEFKQRKYAEISRKLKASVREVQEQALVIGALDPKPGLEILTDEPRYVTPDLIVEKVEERYIVYLNDRNVPRLRISNAYRHELNRVDGADGKETRDFIQSRLASARWLIQTIEQRRRTMVKVMEAIVEEQKDFFEKGTAFLRPLTLQQVASKIGMHESTVSRVTTNKYVQTPRGVFELKFFFSSALSTDDGGEISAKAAKSKIRKIIQEENPHKPYSDQKIADILKAEGLNIARRTVAKYREQLGINPARMRKQY
jgi:RNA polymerase sigma-54 factor